MAGNPTPDNQSVLLSLAEDIADGLQTHGTAIGILQNTEAVMRSAITTLRTAETAYATSKAAHDTAAGNLAAADEAGSAFILATSNVLKIALGTRWSMAWVPTGFPDNSTRVPRSQDKRMTLLASLKNYFTANPAREAPTVGVTAALANTRFTAISDARDDLGQKETDQGNAKNTRDTAFDHLRKRVRGCIDEIGMLLSRDDPRWDAFGLSKPSDPDLPEPVGTITLATGPAGTVHGTWPRAKRAERYRIMARVLTVDTDFAQAGLVHDLDFTLTGKPSGKTIEIQLIAANDAGEAPPSATASIVIA